MSHLPCLAVVVSALALLVSPGADEPAERTDRTAIEQVIGAPVADVWAAFSTSEGMQRWMAPVVELDLAIGGTLRSTYVADEGLGGPNTIESQVLCFDPERMLALKATRFPEGYPFAEQAAGTWGVFYFDALDETTTKVTSVGLGFADDETSQAMRRFHAQANGQVLAKLAALLEADVAGR